VYSKRQSLHYAFVNRKIMSKEKNKATLIDGIASSVALDSSGERVDLAGMDISTLAVTGTVTWDHELTKTSTNVVGKILFAKKIFEEKECSNSREKYYWKKVGMPFLYLICSLFDNFGHSGAKDIVAMLDFDEELDNEKVRQTVFFSIEGSRLGKNVGEKVAACIARKVTITNFPCNHTCVAEKLVVPPKDLPKTSSKQAQEILSKFTASMLKTEQIAVEIINSEYLNSIGIKKAELSMKMVTRVKEPTTKSTNPRPKNGAIAGDKFPYTKPKPKTGADIYNNPNTWKNDPYVSNMRKAIAKSCAPGSLAGLEPLSKEKILKHLASEAWDNFSKKEEILDFLMRKEKEVELCNTFDARIWSEEFMKIKEKNPGLENDEGAMLAWFAASIMAGYDHARKLNKNEALAIAKTYAYLQQLKLEKKLLE